MAAGSGWESVANSPNQTPDPVFGKRTVPDVAGRDVEINVEIGYAEVVLEDIELIMVQQTQRVVELLGRIRALAARLGA